MHLDIGFIAGLVAGLIVVFAAWRASSLSTSGAVAAAAIGIAAAVSGPGWVALLLIYFVSAAALSRIGRAQKAQRTAGMIAKPGARDGWQVLSNGLVFGTAALANAAQPDPERYLLLGAGALAASAADTWATEIGTLFGGEPRSIIGGKPLATGASGGITAQGTIASVAGALFIATMAVASGLSGRGAIAVIAGGIAGSLADSLAGALVQQRLWCDACDAPTEMIIHSCGAPSRAAGGLAFIRNDAVNFLATLAGAGVAGALAVFI